MKTRAAVLRKGGQPWEITELELDEPKAGEVLIRCERPAVPLRRAHPGHRHRAPAARRRPRGRRRIETTGPDVTG